jgi:metal-responsive CopG/Arc/MetJ family transcriptional regulator
MSKRTHIVIPDQLAQDIDAVVGKRGRSGFLIAAAMHELSRLRQLQAIEQVAGLWKDKDHPELKQGAARWVAKQRQLDERRLKKASQ